MNRLRNIGLPSCSCGTCGRSSALSRRQFLCTAATGSLAASIAPSLIGAVPAQAQQAAGRPILLRGGCVLSLDRAVGDFERADVLVEGSRISAIRPNIDAPNAEVIDASNTIVMPGFVDTHRHMWQGFLRNVLPDGSLDDYRVLVQRKFGATMTPDDVYVADLLSALGAIDTGVTCVLDWSHIHNTPEHTDAAIKGLQESGVALCSRTAIRRTTPGDSGR
jgi:cytosine/adenosine deaminase-related metal-dependent hydrolase